MTTALQLEIAGRIRAFILSAINMPALKDDDNLFESGIVNSLFAIQLMTFIERAFGIEVGIDDLDIDHFKSVNAAAAFVVAKIALPSERVVTGSRTHNGSA